MMLASVGYAAAMLQTGAAMLSASAPMSADTAAWGKASEEAAPSLAWSDRSYKFRFAKVAGKPVTIDEKQSRVLHNALIASFDELIQPIIVS